MNKIKTLGLLALILLASQGYSQLVSYLKIPGINGEFQFTGGVDGQNAIAIDSWQFEEVNTINIARVSGGGTAGKAEAPTIEINVLPMDKAIIGLYQKLMTHAIVATPEIRIQVYYIDGSNLRRVEEIKLKNPRIVEISASGSAGDSNGISTGISLKYEAIQKTGYNYKLGTFIDDDAPTVESWNYLTNKNVY